MASAAGAPASAVDPKWAAENNLPRILALTGAFHITALTSVGMRLYVRVGLLRSLGKDDVAMVLAALCALGGWICFILQGFHGFGRHAKTVSPEDMVKFTQIGFFGSIISAIGALGLLKISIGLFLLRLKNNNLWRWYSRCLWGLLGFVAFYTIGAWLTFFLWCVPMEAAWTKKGVCYNQKMFIAFALTNTALNIFTDVCFATLPIPIIWSLQMSRTTRINLIGVLSLGYVAVALGIVKATYQVKRDTDRTFTQNLNVFGFLQLNVGIIAACIPTLKPLLRSSNTNSKRRTRPPGGGRSHYDDIEHAETIGSGRRQYKHRSSFMNTTTSMTTTTGKGDGGGTTTVATTTIDETFEMANRSHSLRGKFGGGGGGNRTRHHDHHNDLQQFQFQYPDRKNAVYSTSNRPGNGSAESEEYILQPERHAVGIGIGISGVGVGVGGGNPDAANNKILCTTEVVINSAQRSQNSLAGDRRVLG